MSRNKIQAGHNPCKCNAKPAGYSQERRSLLRVKIKTSYSDESFIIPDWQPDVHTNYYGRKFFDERDFANFYLRGELCFCDEFEIQDIREASKAEIEEYRRIHEAEQNESIKEKISSITLQ